MESMKRILCACSIWLPLFLALPTTAFGQPAGSSGTITISYTFTHLLRVASNQYAIWIEDDKGVHVRTLFVTSFTARRGGWKFRPDSIPTWTRSFGIASAAQKDIDAVSGATPRSGTYAVQWDLRDAKGRPVAPGTYRYLVEGNIYWQQRVLWVGTIIVGDGVKVLPATVSYSTPDARDAGTLLSEVSASYMPDK